MGKPLILFISLWAIILIHISFSPADKIPVLYQQTQIDSTKKAAADIKAKAIAQINAAKKAAADAKAKADAKKIADAAKKAAQDKKNIAALLAKLIKPFRFRNNEKIRIENLIHSYIINDSIAAAPVVKDINTQMADVRALLEAINKQYTADSISYEANKQDVNVHLQKLDKYDNAVKLIQQQIDAINKKITAKKDTPKVVIPPPPPKDQPLAVTDAMQQKINILRKLIKAPLFDTIYTANKDSLIVRKFTIGQKKEVLGFYDYNAPIKFDAINYKLITTLVYAINADGWPLSLGKNHTIIDSAKKHHLNVVLSFYTNATTTNTILTSKAGRDTFINQSERLLKIKKADGININFTGVNSSAKTLFVQFINAIDGKYKKKAQDFSISINVPANDKFAAYDLNTLAPVVKHFIIDFTQVPNAPGPMSTLTSLGTYSIKNCFNTYLGSGILANKFILGIPYYGSIWNKKAKASPPTITYTDIQKQYADSAVYYNDDVSAAYIKVNEGKAPLTIWFDDDKTLNGKYDFVLANALAGVAIKYIGDDNTTGELKNELIYKFAIIDTTKVDTFRNNQKPSFRDFWEHITTSPCGHAILPVYGEILLIVNLSLIAVLVIGGLILFFGVKNNGETWPYKKNLTYVLIGIFVLWTFVFLMWLFFWDKNPYFGPGPPYDSDCINISFATLFIILLIGTCLGAAVYWFYRKNTPDEQP
ncbi:glycoside hydrolase family 18 protein [Mucilaginibacter sp. HMF5004]|uniref:glycoside hydrolase family 18 protein n=1 Tax=Mucilaginibacter rivuli TaxID=2857527 RepID=UPI001C5F2206|nr:glycoside hydrolase family 18 protein [Mucilaginibacter rivuli]MBW4891601.1 glycoside hydrolase family 18 protein [Mucilaginibacter rivuli]